MILLGANKLTACRLGDLGVDILSIQVNIITLIVNIGSSNGLVLSGNKPLPEPVLTKISVTISIY